jgi:hypothetical protein
MSLRASGLARLASYGQHGSDTTCHTLFWESRNKASIRVPRMFKSHVQQQYYKLVPCLIIQSNYLLHNDSWVWRKIHHCSGKLSVAWAFTGIDRWRGLPNNHLRNQSKNLDSSPRVHLNSNASKLSRLMVVTCKYGGKYDMEANSKETLVWLAESSGKAYALNNLVIKKWTRLLKELFSIVSRSLTVTDP